MAREATATNVELTIPCLPEYVGVARLAILGVASRMRFSYDEVEDVRLAVGEACTISVEWAERNGKQDSTITLRSEVYADKLTIDILDQAGSRSAVETADPEREYENLGSVIIAVLVDDVTVEPHESGTRIRMVKYAGQR